MARLDTRSPRRIRRCLAACFAGLALALLSRPALAQFDWSLYGVADLSWGRFQTSGSLPENRFNSNSLSATFVGLNLKQGLEDGWTPGLTLETFFRFQDFATGRKPSDPLLSRNAFASLGTADYGTLRVGRIQTLLFDTTARFNALGNSIGFSPAIRDIFQSGNIEGVQGDFYWDRAVGYTAPNLEGFTFNAIGAKGVDAHRGDYISVSAVAAVGLFAGAAAAQRVHVNDGLHPPTEENTLQLDGSYNFGIAKVFAQATWTNDVGLAVRSRILTAGFSIPVGPGTIDFQGASSRAEGLAVDRQHSSEAAAYAYAWDSLTDIYVIGLNDRVAGQPRGWSAAIGVRRRWL